MKVNLNNPIIEFFDFLRDFFYYNSFLIFNPFGVIQDLRNYFYMRSIMKKLRTKKYWRELPMRLNWWKMPYTVLNMNEEFFNLPEKMQQDMVVERLQSVFEDFTYHGFNDILALKMEQIELRGELIDSILVYFKPIYYFTSLRNIILTSIVILGFIYKDFLFNIYNMIF